MCKGEEEGERERGGDKEVGEPICVILLSIFALTPLV